MHSKTPQDEEIFVTTSPEKPGSARVVRAEVTEAPIRRAYLFVANALPTVGNRTPRGTPLL